MNINFKVMRKIKRKKWGGRDSEGGGWKGRRGWEGDAKSEKRKREIKKKVLPWSLHKQSEFGEITSHDFVTKMTYIIK